MSLSRARLGRRPSATARPPAKGSTRRRSRCDAYISRRRGTNHRFPPAHFRGGGSGSRPAISESSGRLKPGISSASYSEESHQGGCADRERTGLVRPSSRQRAGSGSWSGSVCCRISRRTGSGWLSRLRMWAWLRNTRQSRAGPAPLPHPHLRLLRAHHDFAKLIERLLLEARDVHLGDAQLLGHLRL